MRKIDGKIFLSVPEVALRLRVTPKTVKKWHAENPKKLRGVTGLGGRLYFEEALVDEAVRSAFFGPKKARVAPRPTSSAILEVTQQAGLSR